MTSVLTVCSFVGELMHACTLSVHAVGELSGHAMEKRMHVVAL